jgi:hypothetical protein
MASNIISVALRTQKLSATKLFFENNLGFKIKESSYKHFVIHTKGLRVVFIESENEFNVELYVDSKTVNHTKLIDPNDIRIVVNCFGSESIH